MNKKAIIVGCGLTGAVIARELAENGYIVTIYERRNHIGGNMFDYKDEHGILVHKYGPHTFHTNNRSLFEYISKYGEWEDYKLTCGALINNICTPTPFNYQTIDDFFSLEEAKTIKEHIEKEYPDKKTITVLEALASKDDYIKQYAEFLFDNDYKLYTAKQWGISPDVINPSVLKRVPLRLDYKIGYFDDEYQVMPKVSYVSFFEKLLNHKNITIKTNVDASKLLKVNDNVLLFNNKPVDFPIVYTGQIDQLFDYRYGELPYRSLRFNIRFEPIESKQPFPVVAYPQDKEIVRIIEYKKLPVQDVEGTTYIEEYSLPFKKGERNEPYYPVPTEDGLKLYEQYKKDASNYKHLYLCGRLGDFKYYNMDQALERALEITKEILIK